MRFNNKTYPVISYLENNMLGIVPLFKEDEKSFINVYEKIRDEFKNKVFNFKKEVNIVSKSFYDSSMKARESLLPILYGEKSIDEILINGTFISGDYCHCIYFHRKESINLFDISLFSFSKKGCPLIYCKINTNSTENDIKWISNSFPIDKNDYIAIAINECLIMSLFKKYANVETKDLPIGQKTKGIDCDYGHVLNETKTKLTWLTSTWFTNLVKSDGFNVRGHFRFQACGQAFKDRKLVWIDEFKKIGYHRVADKLLQNT